MKSIEFRFGELYDVLDDNRDMLDENLDYLTLEPQGSSMYEAANSRIVISKLQVYLREARSYYLQQGQDPEDDEAWELSSAGYLLYEAGEQDPEQWISYSESADYLLMDSCEKAGIPLKQMNQLECRLEFDESDE